MRSIYWNFNFRSLFSLGTLEQRSIFVARGELRLDRKKLRNIEPGGENAD